MNDQVEVYKYSGIIGPALYVVPLVGILSTIILSFAYAYLNIYVPLTKYLSILYVSGFSLGVGFMIAWAAAIGRCRDPLFLYISGAVGGLFALYASWVAFVYVLLNKWGGKESDPDFFSLFFSPLKIWHFIQYINQTGWYTIRSITPSGKLLWILWGIEAIVIIGMIVILSSVSVRGRIFCETCLQWCDDLKPLSLAIPNNTGLLKEIKKGNFDELGILDRVAASEYPHINVEFHCCLKCKNTAGYQLKHVDIKRDRKGKTEEKERIISKLFLLQYEAFESLYK